MRVDAGSGQHIAQHRRQRRQIFGPADQGETRDVTPHRNLAIGLGLVDRRMGGESEFEAALTVGRGDPFKVGGTRPGGRVDAGVPGFLGEGPGPDLFGDVGKHRREQPQ